MNNVSFYRWDLVLIYSTLALVFVYGILRPRHKIEWRSWGIVSAWIIALYAEMYGVPLTLYLLANLLGPHLAPYEFQNGHVWAPMFHLSFYWNFFFTVLAQVLILIGAIISIVGWRHLYKNRHSFVQDGVYQYIRHPQYTGFFLFLMGSLLNWPTLFTLLTAPILFIRYYHLALTEEQENIQKYGNLYKNYQKQTGRFIPLFYFPQREEIYDKH